MEYLEMHGAVTLKTNASNSVVNSILAQMRDIEFVDTGYISVERRKDLVSLEAEGLISESHSIKALLKQLQAQLHDQSMILINSVWWETKVVLKVRKPQPSTLLDLSPQLALAQ